MVAVAVDREAETPTADPEEAAEIVEGAVPNPGDPDTPPNLQKSAVTAITSTARTLGTA